MTDQELRAMVRDAIARTTGATQVPPATAAPREPLDGGRAAFALLPLARGGDTDGMCIIEPSVRCTHCGFCLSYGH
jgi:hypothetical protein